MNNIEDYKFTLEMAVRDYECDIQGIVNNAVYQNYLEHARHEFLKEKGVDFAEFAKQSINLIVVRAELDYKFPLRSGDKFVVGLNIERESKVRFVFHQAIFNKDGNKPCLFGKIIGTAMNEKGRPFLPPQLELLFK